MTIRSHWLDFWGKAQPHDNNGPQWHPLALHSLDVAAVGEALLNTPGGPGHNLPELLGLPRDKAVQLICFLLCLHDIGKFARKFQAKVLELYPNSLGGDPTGIATRYDHGAGGLRLFDADNGYFGLPDNTHPRNWRLLISAVTGHHGAPPEPALNNGRIALRPDFGKVGIETAHAFVRQVHEVFPLASMPSLNNGRIECASFALAGLAVLADWIGSNQEWFPYHAPVEDFKAYWRGARGRAERAVAESGVMPSPAGDHLEYGDLIGNAATPTPMQEWAQSAELPTGPALFLIEDETGSGKTEAALMLVHRLMKSGHADGFYVALPTMATANAMFDRLAGAHRRLFSEHAEPSIALAHGARDMHSGFRTAMLRGASGEVPYSGTESDEASETTASAACAAWIADDRRRAFLADAGAGTVDQALLSVLPSRHQSLRLLGLMRRVLVLDEVHAYDAYMQQEMAALLEFQAGLGGSAILLSATLPVSIHDRLTDAFAKGLGEVVGRDERTANAGMDYPMVTVRAAGARSHSKVAGQPGRARSLPVRLLPSLDEALAEVELASNEGKAVLYIRNTVDDALVAHQVLTDKGINARLFHARFVLVDRLEIEKQVVDTFGKRSEAPARRGQVLIATQVVEQSLDLDFDVLISDLAPVDLLIQRAGRLWRHDRPERRGWPGPELLVVGPDAVDDADENWFKREFPRAAYVYRNHAILWLTARTLQDAKQIDSPNKLRALIESVYGEGQDERLPEALTGNYWECTGQAGAEHGIAKANTLHLTRGYVRDGGAWDSDVRTPTRLDDDPHVTLRLALVRDGRVVPYAWDRAPTEPWRAWRLSEVNVSARRADGEAAAPGLAHAMETAKEDWTRFDSEKILVVLDQATEDSPLVGSVRSTADEPREHHLSYDGTMGLKWA